MVTIYALRCEVTKFVYVGCTECKVAKRMREHRCRLNKGTHRTTKLLDDWQKHGEDNFTVLTLEILPDDSIVDTRRQAELKWLRHYSSLGVLYNEHIISFRPSDDARRKGIEASRHVTGNRWAPEANEKRRLAQLGKPKGHGEKISETKRRLGQKPSKEIASMGGKAMAAKKREQSMM